MYFFDTNFFLLPKASLPDLSSIPKSSRWVTETTRAEIVEKLGDQPAHDVLDDQVQTLHFNDFYKEDPAICPVYYWYILSMYNPANVGSEEFVQNVFKSRLIRGRTHTKEDKKAYELIRRQSLSGRALGPTGRPKDELLRYLEGLSSRTWKKTKKSVQDKHPAILRDIRTLSLILYNTLTTKKDVVFYTTDGDPIPLLLTWADSMSMQLALLKTVLPYIEPMHWILMRGETLNFMPQFKDFASLEEKMMRDLINDRWKAAGVRITIRQWNQSERRFEEDIWLTFPSDLAQIFSIMHGTLCCPFTKNDTNGNWLRFRYHWPPREPIETRIWIEVRTKAILNRVSTVVSPETHDQECLYRQQDATGEIAAWSAFL